LALTIGELRGYLPDQLTVTTPSSSITKPVLLVAIANGRQYGNGAIIAPDARLDDGRLDVVIVGHRSVLRACLELPLIFMGRAGNVGGVTMEPAESVEITSPHPVLYHLDGEPIAGTLSLRAHARARAVRVKVPSKC
jgi:diacylglycerol kinase family enzyme